MRILFLQNSPDVIGGVEIVNKTLAEGFVSRGHRVGIFSMRLLGKNEDIHIDKKVEALLINSKDLVDRPSNKLALKLFKKLRLIKFAKQMKDIVIYYLGMRADCKKMKIAVESFKPDCIIVSYTYMLDCVPKAMLKKTVIHIHTNYPFFAENKFMHVIVNKYKNKVKKVVWNVKATAELGKDAGIKNSISIYNPLSIKSTKSADVRQNKRIMYLGRISPEKQVDLIVKIFSEVIEENDITDWCLAIFGSGELNEESIKTIEKSEQICYYGNTDDPKKELLNSSLLMIASKYESFSLAVFEASECGVPAIAFEFGEPTYEAIINGETGVVVDKGDVDGYKTKLLDLITNPELIEKLSKNAKRHAKLASLDTVIDEWERLLTDKQQERRDER